jgi:ATP-dependent helicase/nuclease subunit A
VTSSFRLPFDVQDAAVETRIDARDRTGRERAVDPRYNVALEASAGTGKTRVLVDRYINLLRAGVDPSNILAITFTRKAATEMRERIMTTLRAAAGRGEIPKARWSELRNRTDEIGISTIDAFCLSLLREFPLEADLDPGFDVADDTEVPRLIDESLDRTLRICRSLAREDENVALVFAQLGDRRARRGLAALLNRRVVAPGVLKAYLETGPRDLDVSVASRNAAQSLLSVFASMSGGLERFLDSGPPEPAFLLLSRDLRKIRDAVERDYPLDSAGVQAAWARARDHFLTQEGEPRKKLQFARGLFVRDAAWATHRDLVIVHAPAIKQAMARYKRDLNVLVSRGILRMYRIAETEYRRTLDAHAVLDFSDLLLRAIDLLRHMEEFSQSRFRLESRYHHVLVDEFQDTSRAQWELVSLLVQSWGEGAGLASSGPLPPSIFIVGDRKQSIYAFRDADVSVLHDASRYLEALRPGGDVRRSISRSFRSVPALLAFVNDVCHDMQKADGRRDAFRYDEEDRFPLEGVALEPAPDAIGLVLGDTPETCAEMTATEIARLIAGQTTVRDKETGLRRPITPADVAILFRTRESHREFEAALEQRGIASYVYKGLGFFDADEIKDVLSLLWYLADPLSNLRAAALLRSRFVRLSDDGLRLLAPGIAAALRGAHPPVVELESGDTLALAQAREASARWRGLVDRMPPAELLDVILAESAYFVEMRGSRFAQARENLKKMRALIRRMQNRGYATLGRIAAHLDRLAVGDESNAVIDALDAVNLMTVHASKGLEFPVVFLVNLARGTGSYRDPIRVSTNPGSDDVSVAVGDFRSDADDDNGEKEREETKRLLYVALTRARDRLYLGSALKDGILQPGRGSLAEALPPSLIEQFSMAGGDTTAEWRATSGAVHLLCRCTDDSSRDSGLGTRDSRTANASNLESPIPNPRSLRDAPIDDFGPLLDAAPARTSIASAIESDTEHGPRRREGRESDRLVGTLVHRLLQRFGLAAPPVPKAVREAATRLVRHEEIDESGDVDALVEAALSAYTAICGRDDLRALYMSGKKLHEVPFTMAVDGRLLRGTVDCLVQTASDRFTVLEFKTGRERPEHRAQMELYRRAMQQVFPGCNVDAQLIYAGAPARS